MLILYHGIIHSAVQKYYMLASVALLFYDLATTLDIEIVRVWSGKVRPFTVLWTLVSRMDIGPKINTLAERN